MAATSGFPRSVFLKPDFDPKAFVESTLNTKHGGVDAEQVLHKIVEDLKVTVQDLTDELLALIDRDHQTFLELSGDLVRVDATVGSLRGPLVHLKEKAEAVRRASAGPTEAIREFDTKLQEVRAKKYQLKQKMLARSLRQSIEHDLVDQQENRAAQKLALLCRILPETECAELRRDLEHRLCEKLLELSKSQVRARLRSLVMIGAVDAARRVVTADLSIHDQETVLERVLSHHSVLLEASAEEGLGSVFEFPYRSILTAVNLTTGKVISSKDARRAEALRKILSMLSPTGTPHAPLRWNPRMHSELRFQDAVQELEKQTNSDGLRRGLQVLYAEEQSIEDVQNDPLLASHLFRMACRLVSGYISFLEAPISEPNVLIDRVADAFRLEQLLQSRETEGAFLIPPREWSPGSLCVDSLASRVNKAGVALLGILEKTTAESCGREVAALDRLITTAYRMTNKPLSDEPSAAVSNVLQPLRTALDQLESHVSKALLQAFVQSVFDEVRAQFAQVSDAMVKRETTLVRYQQRTARAGQSDSYKIARQLATDGEKLVREAETIASTRLAASLDVAGFRDLIKQCLDFADLATSTSAAATPTPSSSPFPAPSPTLTSETGEE